MRALPAAAADYLEAMAGRQRVDRWRRAEFSDFQFAAVVGGRDLRSAEDDAHLEVEPLFFENPLFDAEPDGHRAFVRRRAILDRSKGLFPRHRSVLVVVGKALELSTDH